jgi:hypothetical protein
VLGLSDEYRINVLSLELTDFVNVKKSFGVGTPSSVTQLSTVSGVSHSVTPGSHTVSFTVESADGALYLVLGAPIAGRLDFNLLDF